MRQITLHFLFIGLITPLDALARPGFFIGFGTGTSDSEGNDVSYLDLDGSPFLSDGSLYTTEMPGGTLGSFKLGFNILGYTALETMGQYLHPSSPNNNEAWMANFHVGTRLYPMWHWRGELPSYLQPLEPSVFVGWGAVYQGYEPASNQHVAWSSWNSWRYGAGLEYFVTSYFKLGFDYNQVVAPYSEFIFNLSEGEIYTIDEGGAANTFHQFIVHLNFHFGVEDNPIEYDSQKTNTTEN